MSFLKSPGWNQITDHIFLGDMFSVLDLKLFEEIGITTIISLADTDDLFNRVYHLKKINVIHSHFPDDFTTDIVMEGEILYPTIYRLVENKEKILIHCVAGKSRSTGVVMYYLMKKYNRSFSDVYQLVKGKRPETKINAVFKLGLSTFGDLRKSGSSPTTDEDDPFKDFELNPDFIVNGD